MCNSKAHMKVSIVTSVLNACDTVEDCILSVAGQDHNNIEHIVIDGGSTDGTVDVIKKHKQNIDHIISEPDKGIYDAMNKGIALATGDIIAILNSDDYYAHDSVVSKMAELIENEMLDAAYADLDYVKAEHPDQVVRRWKSGEYTKGAFRRGWVPPHPTFFCRKDIFQKYGGYLDSFEIAADFELMLRFMERYNIKMGYLPEVIVKMRTGGMANNLHGIINGNMEILKAFQINQISVSPLFFCIKPVAKLRQLFNISPKTTKTNG